MVRSEPVRTALPPGVTARPLAARDLDAALRLSEEARWNQCAADWRIFLDLGAVTGLLASDGKLIATAATLPHGGRFAWISMVLVTAAQRRRGLARWLLGEALQTVLAQGLVPALDATPAGREVYRGLAFRDAWGLRRWTMEGPATPRAAAAGQEVTVRPLAPDDWPELVAYDAAVFGAARGPLLRRLAERLPAAALIAERQGRIAGFLLGRDGRVMTQLGPLAAEDAAIARALIGTALARLAPPLVLDLPDRHADLAAWLGAQGFAVERPLTRMIHRRAAAFDDPARLFLIAGPELG